MNTPSEFYAEHANLKDLQNTSFKEDETAVCRADETLDCFLRTKMDVLVMGNWFIAR